jgi:hypothetical protein
MAPLMLQVTEQTIHEKDQTKSNTENEPKNEERDKINAQGGNRSTGI